MKRDSTKMRDLLKRLRREIETALAAVLANNPELQSLVLGKGSFDPDHGMCGFKIEGVMQGGFDKDGALYNILRGHEPSLPELGAVTDYSGRKFKIEGANTTLTKVKARGEWDGKPYLIPTESLLRTLKAQQARAA